MKRGYFLLVVAAVFVTAEVRSAEKIGIGDFSGGETVFGFSDPVPDLTPGDSINTHFPGANFNDLLFATAGEAASNTADLVTFNATITIDMDSAVNRAGFDVAVVGGTVTDIDVNGVSFFGPLAGDFIGIQDPAAFTQVVVTVTATGPEFLVIDDFRFESVPTIVVESTSPAPGDPSSIDFGDVFVGSSEDQELTVKNTGKGTLLFTPTLNGLAPEVAPGPFELRDFTTGLPVATPIPVAPDGEVRLAVKYSPTSVGVEPPNTIEIDHNDLT